MVEEMKSVRQAGDSWLSALTRGAALLLLVSVSGCFGPMTFTEYLDDMEVGEETVVYDGKGHPVITSERGFVDDPYAESLSIEKEDFMRHGYGVVPE